MKKIIRLGSLLLLIFISLQSHATSRGDLFYDGEAVNGVDHKGELKIKNSTVNGMTQVEGLLKVFDSRLQKVAAKGSTEFKKSRIAGSITVSGNTLLKESEIIGISFFKGSVSLIQSRLKEDVRIIADQGSVMEDTTLDSNLNFIGNELKIKGKSVLQNITIEPSPEHPEEPVLYVDADTIIAGDIQFQNLKGKVELASGAKLNGKVINGEIIR